MNPEVDTVRFKQEGENLSKYLDTVFEVARKIEEKGAGNKSVLSQENLAWLKADYGFQAITPEELAKLI